MMNGKIDTKTIADTALAALIEHTNETTGAKADLARRMGEALGYPVHRQVVEGWVHPDPEKRVEPKLGLGIVLLRVGGEMLGHRKPLDLGRTIKKAIKASANGKSDAR